MPTMKIGPHTGSRLRAGDSVLAAAQTVDTRLVKSRLTKFERAQRNYAEAQRQVEAAEQSLRAGQALVAECDIVQDEAVETLARALMNDGHSRLAPFAAFDVPSPSRLVVLAYAKEATQIHRLVAAIRRIPHAAPATLQAAQAADGAATSVEQALVPLAVLHNALRAARHRRNALAPAWEAALAALKHHARAAADISAPQLYVILFDRPRRRKKKRGKVHA